MTEQWIIVVRTAGNSEKVVGRSTEGPSEQVGAARAGSVAVAGATDTEEVGAQRRTDDAFEFLLGQVAKRNRGAVQAVLKELKHERWLIEMRGSREAHLNHLIAIKDTAIRALQSSVDGWREIARRHGDDVERAPERSN